ncbi:MAG: hypothetical protein ACRCSN_19705 [Dermatophilaceae bacterium]
MKTADVYTHFKYQEMNRDNAAYRAAKAEGLQPQAPSVAAVERSRRAADIVGRPVAV